MWKWILMAIPLIAAALELIHGMLGRGHSFVIFLSGLGLVGCGLGFSYEKDWRELITAAVLGCVGSVIVYALSSVSNLGPTVASGVVGLLASKFLKNRYSLIVYTGAFVGMSSPEVLPTIWTAGLAGLFAGLLYEVMEGVWEGIGGRLGTMAATAVIVTILLGVGGR